MQLSTEKMAFEVDGGIGWMIFNNPERRNALSLEMWGAIAEILGSYEADDDIRVVVMKGAGDKAFVSGADISQFAKNRSNAEQAAEYTRISEEAKEIMVGMKKPLIAMIQGYCLGGGLGIALNADIRVASDDSQFGIPAGRLGIAYGFDNLKQLVDLVGPAKAKEILFTARRIQAAKALEIGLLNEVVPVDELEDYVVDMASTIANNAPLSVRASKLTIGEVVKDGADRDLEMIARISKECFDSADYKEGRTAFMEKRKPVFTGR